MQLPRNLTWGEVQDHWETFSTLFEGLTEEEIFKKDPDTLVFGKDS